MKFSIVGSSCSAGVTMRLSFACVTVFLCTVSGAARAEPTLHGGLASEFGRGLGAGLELDANGVFVDSFVIGIGSELTALGSSGPSRIGDVAPGIAFGPRIYRHDFYLGLSFGLNYVAVALGDPNTRAGTFHISGLVDLGYRLRLGESEASSLRLGVSVGACEGPLARGQTEIAPAAALTVSFGRTL